MDSIQAVFNYIGSIGWLGIYDTGLGYFAIASFVCFFFFTCWRWVKAFKGYVRTGYLDDHDDSWFFTKDWIFASESDIKHKRNDLFGNNPWVAAVDFIFAVIFIFVSMWVWPLVLICGGVITSARISRVRFRKKQEFIAKLEGNA